MNSWNEGYVTDMAYSANFFRDLTPGCIRMALLLHGVDMPKRKQGEPLRYLELGYGQGASLNLHAAAVPGEFWGTDFNPDHTLRAEDTARAAGLEVNILNLSFAELDARAAAGELPQFDVIAMHGVWSWVSDDNRRQILSLISRNLKMGGVVYVSYNAMPGWAAFMPARDLMAMHAVSQGATAQNTAAHTQSAYAFARALAKAGAGYFTANPQAAQWLEGMERQSLNYIAHEYMNLHWRPFYFNDVAAAMGVAKCGFVTSTRLLNQLEICLPPECAPLLRQAPNVSMRETLRDYSLNQRFRADLFVKGSRRLPQPEQIERMGALRVALCCRLESVNLSIPGPRGAMTMKEEIYRPVLAALADRNCQPKSIAELEDHPLLEKVDSLILLEALTVLAGAGYLHPAQEKAAEDQAAQNCARLNRVICERARLGESSAVLASPVLGGGLPSSRLEQLFALSRVEGEKDPGAWAEDAWNVLSGRGERIFRDGEELGPEDSLAEIHKQALAFASERLAYLETMRALPGTWE